MLCTGRKKEKKEVKSRRHSTGEVIMGPQHEVMTDLPAKLSKSRSQASIREDEEKASFKAEEQIEKMKRYHEQLVVYEDTKAKIRDEIMFITQTLGKHKRRAKQKSQPK